jgi:N-acetyl-anhydromuramyl-L-alanine amidase AmpD
MDPKVARETLDQLVQYTRAASRLLGVDQTPKQKNHSGGYAEGQPSGVICHYTASNAAVGTRRPYGRLPVLLSRLRPLSGAAVGCHVVVWDEPIPRLTALKVRYPLIQHIPAEVFFFGDELALWHAGSANRWSIGIEVRNCGELLRSSKGALYWARGKYRYRGRPPITIGERYWEPFTHSQMVGTVWVSRLLAAVHPLRPHRFLGHTQVSSTRVDPGPHFPIHEIRSAIFDHPDHDLLDLPFLKEFEMINADQDLIFDRDDPLVSEASLHEGKYRHDWDGDPDHRYELTAEVIDHSFEQLDDRTVVELKQTLRRLGYYPGPDDSPLVTPELTDTVRIFQSRWKKRVTHRGRRRWARAIRVNGKIDQELFKHLRALDRQQFQMVS